MARIRITSSNHHGSVPLSLNDERFTLTIPADGGETSVPDHFLPLLRDSNINYEIVATGDGDGEAEANAGGESGAVSATDPEAGPGSPGTVDETSNAAMPATPPVESPNTNAPPEAAKPRQRKPRAPAKPKAEKAAKAPKAAK